MSGGTTTRTRGPQPGSVFFRLNAFYAANPEEELTYPDIMRKLDCSYSAAHAAVEQLRKKGLVESLHVIRLRSMGIAK